MIMGRLSRQSGETGSGISAEFPRTKSNYASSKIGVLIFGVPSVSREGLNAVLCREQDFTIVGVSEFGKDGPRIVRLRSPDIVIVGTEISDIPAPELIKQLCAAEPGADLSPKILVFGKFQSADIVVDLFRTGVCGFLEEDIMPEILVSQLRQFAHGQPVLGQSAVEAIQTWCARRDPVERDGCARGYAKLSMQERRVLDLLAQGLSTAAIASTLQLSETTVRSHVHRMKLKLSLTTRDKLITFAVRCAERRDSLGE
jgi:DNA-binding NarL/FixJ family response regulator